MHIQEILLEDLREYENNPRNNDGAVQAVADSIKEFGFKVPIVIDRDNVIVAGHTRLKAARLLGLETVPCIVADDLTPEQVKAYRLADNKTGELAEWDFSALEKELSELGEMELDFDMSDFGFDEFTSELAANEENEDGDVQDGNGEDINTESNYKYQEQYGVIVICESEQEQEQVYNDLLERGYNCKVVAV